MYLARVSGTTSSGSCGGGLALSQPVVSSQSRTNCLSNDGCGPPGLIRVACDQYRELSGVSTSSTRSSSPVSVVEPPFELRVGQDQAAVPRRARRPFGRPPGSSIVTSRRLPCRRTLAIISNETFSSWPALGLGRRREDRVDPVALDQPGWQRDAADRSR